MFAKASNSFSELVLKKGERPDFCELNPRQLTYDIHMSHALTIVILSEIS